MKFHKNKLLTTVCAVALTFAVGACSSSSDDDDMMSAAPPPVTDPATDPETDPETPAPLSELASAQADAAAAETAAMTASGEAETAAMAAMAAVANLATMQTNATAGGLAYEAHTAAGNAMAAYLLAKEASGDAAEAEDVTAAVTARLAAEEASANAVKYAMTATEKAGEAETAAAAEVKIVDKTKTVGDTSITVGAANNVATTTTGGKTVMTETGEIGKIAAMSEEVDAIDPMDADPNEDPPVVAVVAKPGIAERSINIGVQLDSDDDTARLTLVTHYIGSGTVAGVYTGMGGPSVEILQKVHSAYNHDGGDDGTGGTATPNVQIKVAPGMFYEATNVNQEGTVAVGAKGTEFYYYDVTDEADPPMTTRTWLKRTSSETETVEGDLSHHYTPYEAVNVAEKLADFPMQTAYKHLHFGFWNGLSGSGANKIADLGIGFVTATVDGMGMTGSDMPNVGTATYNGNWVASVREADRDGDGTIRVQDGDSTVFADFVKGEVDVTLTGLASLDGTIAGDRFSGIKATVVANDHGLTADAKFTGSFSGAFFGPLAAEAGGVFDYTSKDMKDGEFRGAFGGDKQ